MGDERVVQMQMVQMVLIRIRLSVVRVWMVLRMRMVLKIIRMRLCG